MRDTHTSLFVLAPRCRPAPPTLTHGPQVPPVTPTMVAIADYSVGRLQRARRRLRRELLVRLHGGEDLVEMGEVVLRFLRVRRDLSRSVSRSRAVVCSTFNLNIFSTEQSLSLFRFKPADLGRAAHLLEVEGGSSRRRYRAPAVESLCVVLRRLSSPARWWDLEPLFGRSSSSLSEIFYETMERLDERWRDALCTWRGDLMVQRAPTYAQCVLDKGGGLDNCVGFIDGTGLFVARPGGGLQRSVYSGHKRTHMLKFQTVTTPDGLLFHLFGPMEGRRHDITMYREAGMDDILEAGLSIDGVQYCLYGDKAYLLRPWMQVAFPEPVDGEQDADEEEQNTNMAAVRVSVEWGYKEVKQVFTSLDYKRKLKVREGPVGLMYRCAVFLWNVRVCFYGSQTASFFSCEPPTVEAYLALE